MADQNVLLNTITNSHNSNITNIVYLANLFLWYCNYISRGSSGILFFYTHIIIITLYIIPDLGVMWDGMAITFAKMGLRDFFLDAKKSVYVFLVQS